MKTVRRMILLLSIATLPALAEDTLTLDQFLTEVRQNNGAIIGAEKNRRAAELAISESELRFSPRFFTNLDTTRDRRPTIFPAFEGTGRNITRAQAGFEARHKFGLDQKIYTSYENLLILGANPDFITQPNLYRNALVYEASLPLWSGAFGRSLRLQRDAEQLAQKSRAHSEKFQQRQLLLDAKLAYWQLKTARELSILQQSLASRATRFFSWTKARVAERLKDRADLEQARAAMDMRNYELEEAQNQVVLSENRLNEARQLPFGTAIGRLGEWPALALTPGELQVAPDSVREDIAALQKQLESLKAQAELGHEATKPSLDIFGNVLLQGQDQNLQPALASSATTNYPTFYAGVKLSVPLDRVTVSEAAEAAEARRVAAEEMLRRRQYEAGRERENVLLRLAQIQKQFALAGTLVESQQRKLSEEAKRVRIGRSSTFQVLIFEQEALEAEKLLLRNRLALIESHLRLEIFRAIEGV